jgi:hypothetical protein
MKGRIELPGTQCPAFFQHSVIAVLDPYTEYLANRIQRVQYVPEIRGLYLPWSPLLADDLGQSIAGASMTSAPIEKHQFHALHTALVSRDCCSRMKRPCSACEIGQPGRRHAEFRHRAAVFAHGQPGSQIEPCGTVESEQARHNCTRYPACLCKSLMAHGGERELRTLRAQRSGFTGVTVIFTAGLAPVAISSAVRYR